MITIPKHIRMLIACGIALGISYTVTFHQYTTPTQVNIQRLQNDTQSLVASIPQFTLPTFNLATLYSQQVIPTVTPEPIQNNAGVPTMGFEAVSPGVPTSTPYIQPTALPGGIYTSPLPTTAAIPITTNGVSPAPTNTPKPTKPPNVFPVDPSLQRPGTTPDEVFTIASQKTCVPKAVLRAIASIESGGFFDVVDPKWFMLYNSYNWWKSPSITDMQRICSGYGQDGNTGIIPSDSNFAGQVCLKPAPMGGNLVVRGPMSISFWETKDFKSKAARVLDVPVADERVILDALVIAGLSINNEVKPSSCQSWSTHDIVKAACIYYGTAEKCGYADHSYYCNTFCHNLPKYGGKDCSSAVPQFANGCY